jgi:hypothetical protein
MMKTISQHLCPAWMTEWIFVWRIWLRIDVKDNTNPVDGWKSLNAVTTTANYKIGTTSIGNAVGKNLELPYQVYPSQIDGNKESSYWLPLYYTNWIGKNLVVRDDDTSRYIHHADNTTHESYHTAIYACCNRFSITVQWEL